MIPANSANNFIFHSFFISNKFFDKMNNTSKTTTKFVVISKVLLILLRVNF